MGFTSRSLEVVFPDEEDEVNLLNNGKLLKYTKNDSGRRKSAHHNSQWAQIFSSKMQPNSDIFFVNIWGVWFKMNHSLLVHLESDFLATRRQFE